MIIWTEVEVDERPFLRERAPVAPLYSAAVVGKSVVLRVYGGSQTEVATVHTTVAFDTTAKAIAWVAANASEKPKLTPIAGPRDTA